MKEFFDELRRRNVVRVAGVYAVIGWVVVQAADVLQGALNLPDWFDSLVVSLLLLGFPVAMILAWAFDLTPDGIKRTPSESDGDVPVEGHKLDVLIVIGLLVVGGLIGVDYLRSSSEAGPAAPAVVASTADVNNIVAVLPFTNRSPNEDDVFFVDGMHDDLLTRLSKLSDMQVISRTSVMQYRDTTKPIPEIAQELGVAVVLEGAVQRAGDRVRINVQLIDAATDAHLWAEIYDREMTTENLFDIQAEISQTIAASLNAALSGNEQAELGESLTDNLDAYNAYLRGITLLDRSLQTPSRIQNAVAAFDEAISLDDQFATAYSQKTNALLTKYWFFGGNDDDVRRAELALKKAEELAPNAVHTLFMRGYYTYWVEKDYAAAHVYVDQVLAMAPNNARAFLLKAAISRRAGQFTEATRYWERGVELDPLDQFNIVDLASTYSLLAEYPKAKSLIDRAAQLGGRNGFLAWIESAYWRDQSDLPRALDAIWELPQDALPITYYIRARYATILGEPERLKEALDQWPEDHRSPNGYPEAYAIAEIRYFRLVGDTEADRHATDALRERFASRSPDEFERWASNSVYDPLVIPVILDDFEAAQAAIADYKALPSDAWLDNPFRRGAAFTLAHFGEIDASLDYVEAAMDALSIAEFRRIMILPVFDPYREHPRYLELQARYDEWQAANE